MSGSYTNQEATYVTGKPMTRCPSCGRWSGLSGVDGLPCLACQGGYEADLPFHPDEREDGQT